MNSQAMSNMQCDRIGQRDGFSDLDYKKINTLYNCRGYDMIDNAPELPQPEPAKNSTEECVDANQ